MLPFSFSGTDDKSRVDNTSGYLILYLENSFILPYFTMPIRIWLKCPESLELIYIFLGTTNAFLIFFFKFSVNTLILSQKSATSFRTWIILLL